MSGVDPVQAWRDWLSRTHSGPIHIINDEIFKHTEAIAAALEAERERVRELRAQRDAVHIAHQDEVRQRDERIAALAPLEPVGRLVEAMEAKRWATLSIQYDAIPQDLHAEWLVTLRNHHQADAATAHEALAALAGALEREAREGQG